MDREIDTKQWYQDYYAKKGKYRNDIRRNRGVLFQILATDAALVRSMYVIDHDPSAATVLYVGCGDGGCIRNLLQLGYLSENITGIDILAERIAEARKKYPNINLIHGDASNMTFDDATFDLVMESTMFATLTDDALCEDIAREMVRVCKPNGYILLSDWRTPKPRDPNYKALSKRRLFKLFDVERDVELVKVCPGALVPPLGRLLSKWLSSTYFAAASAFPFLVGHVAYVLHKRPVASMAGACRKRVA